MAFPLLMHMPFTFLEDLSTEKASFPLQVLWSFCFENLYLVILLVTTFILVIIIIIIIIIIVITGLSAHWDLGPTNRLLASLPFVLRNRWKIICEFRGLHVEFLRCSLSSPGQLLQINILPNSSWCRVDTDPPSEDRIVGRCLRDRDSVRTP